MDILTISEKSIRESKPSDYLDKFRKGAQSSPDALLVIVRSEEKKNGLVNVQFNRGTKTPWKGLNMTATVEKDALLSIVRSQEINAFKTETNKTFFLAPLEEGKLLSPDRQEYKSNYPKTLDYWKRADRIYKCHRSSKAGETLFDNLDWKKTLSTQLEHAKKERRFKVIYNSSGNILRGAIVSGKQIVLHTVYYLVTDNMEEALYLCGIINAPVMQDIWRESKTSKMHFHKSPWRHVPVPIYNPNNKEHKAIVSAAKEVEQAQNPSDKLDILNEPVQTLLQDFLFNSP